MTWLRDLLMRFGRKADDVKPASPDVTDLRERSTEALKAADTELRRHYRIGTEVESARQAQQVIRASGRQ